MSAGFLIAVTVSGCGAYSHTWQMHASLRIAPAPSLPKISMSAAGGGEDDEIARAQRRRDKDALASEWLERSSSSGGGEDANDDMAMLRERIDLLETKERDLTEIRAMLRQMETMVGVQFVGDDDEILLTAWVFVALNVLVALYALKTLIVDPVASSIPAAQAVEAPSWYDTYLGKPGFELQYGEYLDPASGQMIHPIEGTKMTSSGPLLLLCAGATRLGGILPDEMPFNLVQKCLRLIPGVSRVLPDLRDGDPRKAYQDTWYGTDVSASLPKAMRSRRQEAPSEGSAGGETGGEQTESLTGDSGESR